ncbi:immunoglobulin domain-containing protein Bsg [Leptinotarsa decemlineata]|uniref:immunoglobulin domain-containing protein Bsg n=1 Tax=Leptinotarsa decemlineata TaxID=7539 RepID=UPI000C25487B|nr:neuroplastin [Leptinotarsa decemlineata]
MKNLVSCVILNFLFFINTVYSEIQITPVDTSVVFLQKKTFNLACNVSYSDNQTPTIKWKKDGKEVTTNDRITSKWDASKHVHTLTVNEATDNDIANYTCIVLDKNGVETASGKIRAARSIAVKVPSDINVVEEERLRIECKIAGNPSLSWVFDNETYAESRDRVIIEDYKEDDGKLVKNGVFILLNVTKEDRGLVSCIGEDRALNETSKSDCLVRVKDKYAALWPFLGICAEVIILCAIIVIYEKKRNKTELEESDTDQSPDQKNTPDHGKDSNLRHRQ